MQSNHTLGMVNVSDGELLTFTIDRESHPDRPITITVIALADIDLSKEMADFYHMTAKDTTALITENAIVGFVNWLANRGMLRLPVEHRVHLGNLKRPSSRLTDEYKYSINPEMFWEAKLLHRYSKACFNVINHQSHMLTVMANVDAPFTMTATIIDGVGGVLGMLRLDILSDAKHTLISDEDIERLRLGLQADITMHVTDLMLMVEGVSVASNPTFGINSFNKHRDFIPLQHAVPSL
jgi:hypothetical protein